MTDPATVIAAHGLSFGFPREDLVLNGVDLTVGHEVVALTGTSGTGKTTLLLCLAGILVPSSGAITVAGHHLHELDLEGRSRVRRENIGLVFQFSEMIAELTLAANVALPLELTGTSAKAADAAARSLLTDLDLGELADRYPTQVSGGQAQRAAVARALIHQPAVILADEPTGALDSANGAKVLQLLLDAARDRGCAVVLVTHDADVAARADRVIDVSSLSRSSAGTDRL